MQSDKAPKKTSKPAKRDAARTAESAAAPEKIAKPRAARVSKPKTTDSSDMVSGKHHHSAAPKSAKPAATSPESQESGTVNEAQIAALAYSYWAERGYRHGSHEEDWLRAERELAAAK
jgi:hypothetical protein